MSRKPRSDSKLLNLPQHQQDALADWLLDGMSYADARERLHMDFNVQSSEAALGGFYQHVCAPLRLRRASEAANALPELAGGLTTGWDVASVALVQRKYFELLAAPFADPKELAVFAMQIADINRGQLERAKLEFNKQKHAETTQIKTADLALQREKFEFDAAKKAIEHAAAIKTIATNRSLDSDARVEQVRLRLFGSAPQSSTEVSP